MDHTYRARLFCHDGRTYYPYQGLSVPTQPRMSQSLGWQMRPYGVPPRPPPPCLSTKPPAPSTLRIAVPILAYGQPPPSIVAFAHPPPRSLPAPVPVPTSGIVNLSPGQDNIGPQFFPNYERRKKRPLAIVNPNQKHEQNSGGKLTVLQSEKKETNKRLPNEVVGLGSEVKQSTEDERLEIVMKVPVAELNISSVERDSEPPKTENEKVAATIEMELLEKELEAELSTLNQQTTLFHKTSGKSLKEYSQKLVKIAPKPREPKTKDSTKSLANDVTDFSFKNDAAQMVLSESQKSRKTFASIAKAQPKAPNDRLDLQKLPKTTAKLRILPRPRSENASIKERPKSCLTRDDAMQTTKEVYSLQEHLVVVADDNLEFLYEDEGRVLISLAEII